jgi:hypothetical protein
MTCEETHGFKSSDELRKFVGSIIKIDSKVFLNGRSFFGYEPWARINKLPEVLLVDVMAKSYSVTDAHGTWSSFFRRFVQYEKVYITIYYRSQLCVLTGEVGHIILVSENEKE